MSKAELRVFVASPGGLDEERNAVEQVAADLNATLGDQLNVVIVVLCFEQLSARPGRPQEQINQWVDACDILIAIVHRRWGSPSGNGDSTGFSEEFDLAIERFESTGHPVVSLHFKAVDPESEADAGPQLEQVLAFRRRIESDHIALYRQFDSLDAFKLNTMQLLVEEMHSVSGKEYIPDEGPYNISRADEAVPVSSESPAQVDRSGIVKVLETFSNVIQKKDIYTSPDFDRLVLFAAGVSRDSGFPSVHLLNRIFQRSGSPEYSVWEINSWFKAYVADHGSALSAEQRVIPFAQVVGNEKIKSMLLDRVNEILASDIKQLHCGYLRLITAYRLRPEVLWANDDALESWTALAKIGVGAEAVDYWATVSCPSDSGLAARMAESDDSDCAKLGLAVSAVNEAPKSSDAIIAIDPTLILGTRIGSRIPGGLLARSSTEVLAGLLERQYIEPKIQRDAVVELARRNEWPRQIVVKLVDRDRVSNIRGDSWKSTGRKLLFQNADSTTLSSIIEEADKSKARDLILADLAAQNREFRSMYTSTLPDYVETGSFVEYFALNAGDPSLTDQAFEVIRDEFEPANRYIERLRVEGARPDILEFARERNVVSALEYLIGLKVDLPVFVHDRLLSLVDNSSLFKFDCVAMLEAVATDADIPTILANKVARWHDDRSALMRLMSKATGSRLRDLVDHESSKLVVASLEELERRSRLPTREKLEQLLHHGDASVRMAALNCLIPQITNYREFIDGYEEREDRYYYNVVCELDRISAGCPRVFD
jgi:hypothetical protein